MTYNYIAAMDDWAKEILDCSASNRKLAEAGIYEAYEAAGLLSPNEVRWYMSPDQIVMALAKTSLTTDASQTFGEEVSDKIRQPVDDFFDDRQIDSNMTDKHWDQYAGFFEGLHTSSLIDSVSVLSNAFAIPGGQPVSSNEAEQRWDVSDALMDYWCGTHTINELKAFVSIIQCCADSWDRPSLVDSIDGLKMALKHTSTFLPYAHVCLACDHPESMGIEDNEVSIRWRDGIGVNFNIESGPRYGSGSMNYV